MDHEMLSKNTDLQAIIRELGKVIRETHPDRVVSSILFLLLCNDIHVFCNKNGFLVNIIIKSNPPKNDLVNISLDLTKTDVFDEVFTDAGIYLKMYGIPLCPN